MKNAVELKRMDTMNNGEFLMNYVESLGLPLQQRSNLVALVNNYAEQLVADEKGGSFCPFRPDGGGGSPAVREVQPVSKSYGGR